MAPAQRGYAQRSSKPKPGRKPRQGKEVANAVSVDNDSNTNEGSHRSPHDDVSDLIHMVNNIDIDSGEDDLETTFGEDLDSLTNRLGETASQDDLSPITKDVKDESGSVVQKDKEVWVDWSEAEIDEAIKQRKLNPDIKPTYEDNTAWYERNNSRDPDVQIDTLKRRMAAIEVECDRLARVPHRPTLNAEIERLRKEARKFRGSHTGDNIPWDFFEDHTSENVSEVSSAELDQAVFEQTVRKNSIRWALLGLPAPWVTGPGNTFGGS
ncbi:hypothetical protein LTR10_008833 [Elasticomyces elasticus]|nr:hypothetical protein LTR10_008833 [Elasticomyces elasticus]KAK4974196.1 hypothetical protein LTR42_004835 [Elasticomyces elasticus]